MGGGGGERERECVSMSVCGALGTCAPEEGWEGEGG